MDFHKSHKFCSVLNMMFSKVPLQIESGMKWFFTKLTGDFQSKVARLYMTFYIGLIFGRKTTWAAPKAAAVPSYHWVQLGLKWA